MALQIFNADSVGNGVRETMNVSGDGIYVMEGVLVGREDAISDTDYTVVALQDDHLIKIDGSIVGGAGVQLGNGLTDSRNKVLIGGTGSVQALLGSGSAIHATGSEANVENHGSIWSNGTGIFLDLVSGAGGSRITNSGTIEADTAIHRTGGTQSVTVENSGTIKAFNAFYSDGDATDWFTNTGDITGYVLLGGGDDRYMGSGGTISGVVYGADGEDILTGGAGADFFTGGDQNDTLEGGGGNDELFGANHNDTLAGGAGADELNGGDGTDTMEGGTGNDLYYVDIAADSINEAANQGTDTVISEVTLTLKTNFERLTLDTVLAANGTGNAVANIITGGDGANHLRGLAGNDQLLGMAGADKLTGGTGADRLAGGADGDRFIFNSAAESRKGNGIDKIIDFSRAEGDKIELTAIDANSTIAGNQAFKFIGTKAFTGKAGELRYVKAGSDSIITADINGDGKADFTVISDVAVTFSKGDFIL
ncbi:MAG TPA: calcium-binding protein [Rhizobiaceae bacterium]|nr:calcium-binding protein [Rhizobiaceae bacterium]